MTLQSPPQTDSSAPPPAAFGARARWITWRSVTIGTLAASLIAGLSTYNDWVVVNTTLIGSYFPPSLCLLLFLLVVLVNAPLLRWFPSRALSMGELGVI